MDFSLSAAGVEELQQLHGFYTIHGRSRRYRVHTEQPLGHGSAGTVYAGEVMDGSEAGQRVAVKVICRAKAESTPGRQELLRREVAAAGKLRHQNIVQLLDVVRDAQSVHLVMELASGGELFERVAERGCLPEREAGDYVWQILNAVAHCHSMSVCHRDLKLENVLLTAAIDDGTNELPASERVLLTDFGFSKDFGESLPRTHNVGTLMYMAPELLQYDGANASRSAASAGQKDELLGALANDDRVPASPSPTTYDPCKVDAWSVGVILYVLVCGTYPFGTGEPGHGRSPLRTFKRILSGDFEQLPIGLSSECVELLQQSLRPNPTERLSIAEMRDHPWFEEQRERCRREAHSKCGTEIFVASQPIAAESLSTMLAALDTPGSKQNVTSVENDEGVGGLTTSMASLGSCSSMLEGSMDSIFEDCDCDNHDIAMNYDQPQQFHHWAYDMSSASPSYGGSPTSPRSFGQRACHLGEQSL